MKRPLPISIICILGFIGTIFTPVGLFLSSFSPVSLAVPAVTFPTWYIVLSLLFAVIYFFGLIKIWQMKKIGIEIYTFTAIIEYIVGFATGFASVLALVISTIAIGIIWIYYKRMTPPSLFSKNKVI